MKKTHMALFLVLTMLLTLCAAGQTASADGPQISEKELTFYLGDPEMSQTGPVYFAGDSDVPYLALSDWADLMTMLLAQNEAYNVTCTIDGETGTLTREDGYTAVFDAAEDTITFEDFDAFMRPDSTKVIIDVLSADNPSPDGDKSFFRRLDSSYERYGSILTLKLSDYDIDILSDGQEIYVPVQTLSDFFLSLKYINLCYNGEAIFIAPYQGLVASDGTHTPYGDLYYSVQPAQRSQAMADFGYNELCLALDSLYGLKQSHGFTDFDTLFKQSGLEAGLRSTDPAEADEALYRLINFHMDDQHSAFLSASAIAPADTTEKLNELGAGRASTAYVQQAKRYDAARSAAYPNGVPAYEEIGNTAYITFDSFESTPATINYYDFAPTEENVDTIGILLRAYAQIMRDGSPIENVVLDLSMNGGGDADTAVFTISSFLGEGYVSLTNTMTGAMAIGEYEVDLNRDGQFDEGDLGLLNKNLYCITSPISFSCGNLVPCVFKNANTVTLLGRTSGGGSCVVMPMSTAWGTIFQTSGCNRLAFIKNGSFYDIDEGAVPDFILSKPATFYDRVGLTDYINTLK